MKLSQLWKIRRMLTNSIRQDGPMLVVAKVKDDNIIAMEGSPREIAKMLVKTMEESDEIAKIFRLAVDINKKKPRKSMGTLIDDLLKNGIDKFLEDHLDCDNCPVKDTCPIIDEVKQLKKSKSSVQDPSKN